MSEQVDDSDGSLAGVRLVPPFAETVPASSAAAAKPRPRLTPTTPSHHQQHYQLDVAEDGWITEMKWMDCSSGENE